MSSMNTLNPSQVKFLSCKFFKQRLLDVILKSQPDLTEGQIFCHLATDLGFNTTNFYVKDLLEDKNEYVFDWEWDWTLQTTDGVITDFDFEITSYAIRKIMTVDVASVNVRYADGSWWRMGSTKQGVPFGNATAVGVIDWGKYQPDSERVNLCFQKLVYKDEHFFIISRFQLSSIVYRKISK